MVGPEQQSDPCQSEDRSYLDHCNPYAVRVPQVKNHLIHDVECDVHVPIGQEQHILCCDLAEVPHHDLALLQRFIAEILPESDSIVILVPYKLERFQQSRLWVDSLRPFKRLEHTGRLYMGILSENAMDLIHSVC